MAAIATQEIGSAGLRVYGSYSSRSMTRAVRTRYITPQSHRGGPMSLRHYHRSLRVLHQVERL